MNSRQKILAAVKAGQPQKEGLPELEALPAIHFEQPVQQFRLVLESIGGQLPEAENLQQVTEYVTNHFTNGNRYVTSMAAIGGMENISTIADARQLQDVEAAVVEGEFAVAENAAIWVRAATIHVRALPFICQHLVVVLHPQAILHNMHEAYKRIGPDNYDYGVFIAGPSKTADIEQSLVLGAHGPKSLAVFLVDYPMQS